MHPPSLFSLSLFSPSRCIVVDGDGVEEEEEERKNGQLRDGKREKKKDEDQVKMTWKSIDIFRADESVTHKTSSEGRKS